MSAVSLSDRLVAAPIGDAVNAPRKPSIWRRLFEAFSRARMRQAEREIALFLERSGGRWTDDVERRMFEEVAGIGRRGFND